MSRYVVARVADIPPGTRKLVEVKKHPVAVFNINGEFHALFDRCPHQGGSLCSGLVTGLLTAPRPGQVEYSRKGEFIRCPWHGWEFDIRTGKSKCDPGQFYTRAYEAGVASGASAIEGRYAAETLPVVVEDDYVVVEV